MSTWRGSQLYRLSDDIAVGALGWMLQAGGEAVCSLTLQYRTKDLRPREGRGAPAVALRGVVSHAQ